ncbi:MAG: thioredoxin family protein [Cyclobacteriaceae bacterium]
MKTIVLLFLTLSSGLIAEPNWQYNFDQAKAEAKRDNKPIILNFSGSDWCGPCIKMTRDIFDKDTFINYAARHLVMVRADFPRSKKNQLDPKQIKHNEVLAEKYNPQGKFPLTLLLDANGKVLKTWDGFKAGTPESFIDQINQTLGN